MAIDLERARARLALLADYGREASMGSLEALLDRACVLAANALSVQRAKALCYRPDSGDLLIVAGVGWREGVVGQATLKTDLASPPGRAYQTGSPVTVEDLTASEEYRHSKLLREHGVVSLINVPIFLHGRVWGVFEIDHVEPRRFDEDDENFMAALAHLIGAAIARNQAESRDRSRAEASAADSQRYELLTRELHHRIKNNFQLIVSLLMMHHRRLTDDDARSAVARVAEKVISIGMAHEQLSMTGESSAVSMSRYLTSLIARIAPVREDIVVEHDIDEITLSLDRAVVVGLVLNEAFTNAEKYAFGQGRKGAIQVALKPVGRGEIQLSVTDNGRGIQVSRNGGQGLALMHKLAEQLSGRLELESAPDSGFSAKIIFPIV